MFAMRLCRLCMLWFILASLQAAEVKKWTDENGKVHYGDIAVRTRDVEILEVDDPAPEVTEGEKLMRMKNDLYFEQLELKRQQQRLARMRAATKKREQALKEAKQQEKKLDSNRRTCIKAKLKIEDIKDDLREGYTTSQGVQLEKKLRRQQRRVDVYC